jgi:hypothetical protein
VNSTAIAIISGLALGAVLGYELNPTLGSYQPYKSIYSYYHPVASALAPGQLLSDFTFGLL